MNSYLYVILQKLVWSGKSAVRLSFPMTRNNLTSSTPCLRIICWINDSTGTSSNCDDASSKGDAEDDGIFGDGEDDDTLGDKEDDNDLNTVAATCYRNLW